MANEIRLRANNISGTITDNPLGSGTTTINSASFVDLPVVDGTSHLILILDPLETTGPAEIVRVTAHTALATSVTVQRGQEGSSARSHIFGSTWFHGPVVSDWVNIVTSGTRPSPAYEGSLIYETDTNKLVGFGGVDWAPRDAGGQIGYAQVVAGQGSITTEVDLTGLSVAVTVGTGRRVKITGQVLLTSTVDLDETRFSIKEGAALLNICQLMQSGAGKVGTGHISHILSPSVGVHTYKLTAQRVSGSGTVSTVADPTFPAYILVEDIGAA